MENCQKILRKSLLKYGSIKEIIKKAGIFAITDSIIQIFVDLASKRLYRPSSTNYGLQEVFFRSKYIDQFERYACVVNNIQKTGSKVSVLEIGAGGEGLSKFSNLLEQCDFFLFDVRKEAVTGLKKKQVIIGDGCRLPFRDKSFDVIVSVDAVEHIPKSVRHSFYAELQRVCKKSLIITCPLQSNNGVFQGETYDIVFQHFYEHDYGFKEPNTAQHIASKHPTLEEINRELNNPTICGYKNCDVWLKYMLFASKPFIGFFCGVLYYLFWKKNSVAPPYWGAIITSDFENYRKLCDNRRY
jgi:ubiquinone/menaquinone biosynthesis C-methylase UbiE